jgi:hypothetical protein
MPHTNWDCKYRVVFVPGRLPKEIRKEGHPAELVAGGLIDFWSHLKLPPGENNRRKYAWALVDEIGIHFE